MFWFQENKSFSVTLKNGFELVFSPPDKVPEITEEVYELTKLTVIQRNSDDEPILVGEGLVSIAGMLKTIELLKGLPRGFSTEELKKVFERVVIATDLQAKNKLNG